MHGLKHSVRMKAGMKYLCVVNVLDSPATEGVAKIMCSLQLKVQLTFISESHCLVTYNIIYHF